MDRRRRRISTCVRRRTTSTSSRRTVFSSCPRSRREEELTWLTEVFLAVLDDNAGTGVFEPGYEPGQEGPPRIQQSIGPEIRIPELLETTFRRNAMHFAAALLNVPADRPHDVGPHDPQARAGSAVRRRGIRIRRTGSPNSTTTRSAAGCRCTRCRSSAAACSSSPDRTRARCSTTSTLGAPASNLLLADGVDASTAVACPLPAGGATFHHHLTLHYTAPNTTDLDRLAFPMEFQLMPRRREKGTVWPWVQDVPRCDQLCRGRTAHRPRRRQGARRLTAGRSRASPTPRVLRAPTGGRALNRRS